MIFGQLIESIRLEARTKEQQLRGLSRMTGHIGNVNDPKGGYVEKHPVPRRTRPAPKRGYDTFPSKVKYHADLEKETSKELARAAEKRSKFSKASRGAKTIKALRAIRDQPSKKKERKAQAALRLPIKFPKDR